ncbi:MAG: oligopeptide/dipeptide ABC transporter ATP-binding protein, partial [Pseudomonadota bacterium]
VMNGGQIVEHAEVIELFTRPRHPYTRAMMDTLPALDDHREERLLSIAGAPPVLKAAPAACSFAPRCAHAFDRCWAENPRRQPVGPGHDAACWWDVIAEAPRDV